MSFSEEASIYRVAANLLGGRRVLHREIRTNWEAHNLVQDGIPAAALEQLLGAVRLSKLQVLAALGVSTRHAARHKNAPASLLPTDTSGRLWTLAETVGRATDILGSQEAAERWLNTPAFALPRRAKPIDLLITPPGARMVSELLGRIEFGVYT